MASTVNAILLVGCLEAAEEVKQIMMQQQGNAFKNEGENDERGVPSRRALSSVASLLMAPELMHAPYVLTACGEDQTTEHTSSYICENKPSRYLITPD